MAMRYCGDVEMRISVAGNRYRIASRWPRGKATWKGALPLWQRLPLSERYDRAALAMIKALLRKSPRLPVEENGRGIVIRRTFQAPCPVRAR